MIHTRNLDKVIILLVFLAGCTMTNIRVHNDNGSTSTVDASISANPQVDPILDLPSNTSKPPVVK